MREILLTIAAATALSAAIPSAVLGQPAAPAAPGGGVAGGAAQTAQPNQLRAKDLIDRDVYTSDGVEVGEVADMLLDPAQGRIVAVVIELETNLGFAERYIAVPIERLRPDPGRRRVTVAMTREEIRAAPGIRYRD